HVGIDEGVVDGLQVVTRGQLAADGRLIHHRLTLRGHARGAARERGGNRVVTVDARDLLDQVFLHGDIEAARRGRHPPAVGVGDDLQAERTQDALYLRIVD